MKGASRRGIAAPAGKFVFATDGDQQRMGYAMAIAEELKKSDAEAEV